MPRYSRAPQGGFTLVELVAVLVLLGVLAAATTQFIRQGVEIYADSARRDNLQQLGRFAVERISRELRDALPGSVRVAGDCLEFAPIEAASSYLGNVADFQSASMQAVDFQYTDAAVDDRRVAVFAIDPNDVYIASRKAVVDLDDVNLAVDNERRVDFKNFAGPGHRFRSESPSKRFYIITQPVSFCVRGNQIFRHQYYGWFNPQATDVADIGDGVLLAEHVQTTDDGNPVTVFAYTAGDLQRAGVVHLDLRLSDVAEPDEWVRFSQEVFVRNVP